MKTETLLITKCNYTDKDKAGNPLISKKSGKPYFKVGIRTQQYGDTWINGFTSFAPTDWEGKTKELEITDDEKWGKQFKLPPRAPAGGMSKEDMDKLITAINAVNTNVLRVIGWIQEQQKVEKKPEPETVGTAFDDEEEWPDLNA